MLQKLNSNIYFSLLFLNCIKKTSILIKLGGIFLFCFLFGGQVRAANYHASVMLGYDFIGENATAFDFTVFVGQYGGARYSTMNEVKFDHGYETSHSSDQVSNFRIIGNSKSLFLFSTADYKVISKADGGPFDFLTAYYGGGYGEIQATVFEDRYHQEGQSLVRERYQENLTTSVNSLVFGFYGQEEYVVLDGRVLYYRGKFSQQGILTEDIEFQHFAFLISLGIGF